MNQLLETFTQSLLGKGSFLVGEGYTLSHNLPEDTLHALLPMVEELRRLFSDDHEPFTGTVVLDFEQHTLFLHYTRGLTLGILAPPGTARRLFYRSLETFLPRFLESYRAYRKETFAQVEQCLAFLLDGLGREWGRPMIRSLFLQVLTHTFRKSSSWEGRPARFQEDALQFDERVFEHFLPSELHDRINSSLEALLRRLESTFGVPWVQDALREILRRPARGTGAGCKRESFLRQFPALRDRI